MTTNRFPEIRQVVLLTSDLEQALATARSTLGVPTGLRAVEEMREIGFSHEVFGFDRTYIEICEPIDADSRLGQRAAAAGSGFMVVAQVEDFDAMLARAKALGIEPLFAKDHHGSPISQWHPRDLGTIAEIDEMRPADSWHFAPDVYGTRSTSVVEDVTAVYLSVADPEEMARRWATIIDGELVDGTSVRATNQMMHFAEVEGTRDVYRVDCRSADRGSVGKSFELCGVTFAFV